MITGEHIEQCERDGYLPLRSRFSDEDWIAASDLENTPFRFGYETEAINAWLDPTMTRGKGLSQAKSLVDQYAY